MFVFGSKWKSHTPSSSMVRVTTLPACRIRNSSTWNSGLQIDAFAAACDRALQEIHLEVGDVQHRAGVLRRRPAGQGIHPRQQFGESKGLDQIIVAAGF